MSIQRIKGRHLHFISRVLRDGSGVEPCDDMDYLDNDTFTVMRLSISEDTYMAIGFNTYVVRKKIEQIAMTRPCEPLGSFNK